MHAKSWIFTAKISVKALSLLPQHPLPPECFSVTLIILVQFLHSANIISLREEVETANCSLPHHLL